MGWKALRPWLGVAAATCLLGACQSIQTGTSAPSASWRGGRVFAPERGPWKTSFLERRRGILIPALRTDIAADPRHAAIVYVHASAGIRDADADFATTAASWGYLVFIPD